jgi:hypothetical protein
VRSARFLAESVAAWRRGAAGSRRGESACIDLSRRGGATRTRRKSLHSRGGRRRSAGARWRTGSSLNPLCWWGVRMGVTICFGASAIVWGNVRSNRCVRVVVEADMRCWRVCCETQRTYPRLRSEGCRNEFVLPAQCPSGYEACRRLGPVKSGADWASIASFRCQTLPASFKLLTRRLDCRTATVERQSRFFVRFFFALLSNCL